MSRLNDRINKLENGSGQFESGPRCIIVRGLSANDQKSEIVKLSGHGMSFERLPTEDEDSFIERAKAEVRSADSSTGPVLFFGGW
jgi:hypothetical protein